MPRYKLGEWSAEYATDVDAYIDALRALQHRIPNLFAELRGRCATKARTFFAPTPRGLFLKTPSLANEASHYRRIGSGWYADTNLSNKSKDRVLQTACELAGLSFPGDFEIEFSSEHYSPMTRADVDALFDELDRVTRPPSSG
jgi:hypothetical protein